MYIALTHLSKLISTNLTGMPCSVLLLLVTLVCDKIHYHMTIAASIMETLILIIFLYR